MARNRMLISAKERVELRLAYNKSRDELTRTRILGVCLYAEGINTQRITEIVGCSRRSLMNWLRTYRDEGIAGLYDKRKGGNSSKLTRSQMAHLQVQVNEFLPSQLLGEDVFSGLEDRWTVSTIAELIERNYGVIYASPNSYRNLLRTCGIST